MRTAGIGHSHMEEQARAWKPRKLEPESIALVKSRLAKLTGPLTRARNELAKLNVQRVELIEQVMVLEALERDLLLVIAADERERKRIQESKKKEAVEIPSQLTEFKQGIEAQLGRALSWAEFTEIVKSPQAIRVEKGEETE